jgi:hypothetical protein
MLCLKNDGCWVFSEDEFLNVHVRSWAPKLLKMISRFDIMSLTKILN